MVLCSVLCFDTGRDLCGTQHDTGVVLHEHGFVFWSELHALFHDIPECKWNCTEWLATDARQKVRNEETAYRSDPIPQSSQRVRKLRCSASSTWINCSFHFSIFELLSEVMSGTVFLQLFIGTLFMSIVNFELEMVGSADWERPARQIHWNN